MAFFGLLKRGVKVYAAIIPEAKTETLLPIIYQKAQPDSIVYRDTFRSCNALDISTFHHRRINHSRLFADQHNRINEIENFGTKPNGISGSLMASKSRNSSGF